MLFFVQVNRNAVIREAIIWHKNIQAPSDGFFSNPAPTEPITKIGPEVLDNAITFFASVVDK